jgi:hypothetical protein
MPYRLEIFFINGITLFLFYRIYLMDCLNRFEIIFLPYFCLNTFLFLIISIFLIRFESFLKKLFYFPNESIDFKLVN